ncbi:TetR/AcrR family transcriptional regulator [Acetobacterium sp.]|uniref:TetR/AcrR family transcriptional regulator n=1 Tax=Acetobacterium sp. TaxID=1872094 RepID=UPI003593CC7E
MNAVHLKMKGGRILARVIENPKQLILSHAKEILYQQGYQKLSMRTLSKACGIALGTIYNYYPTKKDLVFEMMTDYWQRFLDAIAEIIAADADIYLKLNRVFNELEIFIRNFRQYWLTPELYGDQAYSEGGLQQDHRFIDQLIDLIAAELTSAAAENTIQIRLGAQETAKFIILNCITIVQMPLFRYETFELFLKELLK